MNLVEHLEAALTGHYFEDPFRVHYFKPFPDDVYSDIIRYMPDDQLFRPPPPLFPGVTSTGLDTYLPDGTCTRSFFSLREDRVAQLPEPARTFWLEFSKAVSAPEFNEVFKRHMAPELKCRFKMPIEKMQFLSKPTLIRDKPGYHMRPHTDRQMTACTIWCYLAKDHSSPMSGTVFYSRRHDGSLRRTFELQYLPNTAFGFVVTKNSWHGPAFIEPLAGLWRDGLLLNLYAGDYHDEFY